jgi:DNA-binding transcriptional LysR family regulator
MREGNVTRAAKRLGRTQSAVSHSLARLREQLGDPLMVKSGGRMMPTPFAQELTRDIRPILQNIQRVVSPPEPFVPETSRRLFRIAIPAATSAFMVAVMSRVYAQAPGAAVEWLSPNADAFATVVAGLIDIVEVGGPLDFPDGIEVLAGEPLTWMTYARIGHPATKNWGLDAWARYPHIKLKIGNAAESPVDEVARNGGPARTIGAWVNDASSIPAMLRQTDLLGTFPPIIMCEGLKRLGLCALEPPVPIPVVPMHFIWSRRLSQDSGSKWFRDIVIDVFNEQRKAGERSLRETSVIQAAPAQPSAGRRAKNATSKRRRA